MASQTDPVGYSLSSAYMARLAQLLKRPSPKFCLGSGFNMPKSFSADQLNREQGKLIPEAAAKAGLREMNSLKSVKSLNDQDLPLLGRINNQSGHSHYFRDLSISLNQEKRRRADHSLQRTSSVLFIGPMA